MIALLKRIKAKWNNYNSWNERIRDVISSADNQYITRYPLAGKIRNGCQIMHNGQKVIMNSYYGSGITRMLKENKGVHEPQEERVFAAMLESLPKQPVMIELGSYWGFYSMWFLQARPEGTAILYESDKANLEFGRKNFALNNLLGDFNHAFISSSIDQKYSPIIINLPFIFKDKNLGFIDVLHSDIQGYELELLKGGRKYLEQGKIGYLFISTHSNELHNDCLSILKQYQYEIIAEVNLDHSHSVDGIIVVKHKDYPGITSINISIKNA